MPARLRWDGLDELKALLRALPADLTEEAAGIVLDAADAARDEIYAAYPARTGNLRNGLKVASTSGSGLRVGSKALGANAILYNNAHHAWIFEHGTTTRKTDLRATGMMPPGNVFIPRAIRHRAAMWDQLAAMVEAHGFTVTRHAA